MVYIETFALNYIMLVQAAKESKLKVCDLSNLQVSVIIE